MKHRSQRQSVDLVLNQNAILATEETVEMERRIDRAWNRVRSEIRCLPEEPVSIYVSISPPRSARRRALLFAFCALTIVVASLTRVLIGEWWTNVPVARVEGSGASDAAGQRVSIAEIDRREVFRSDDRTGTTLILPDESRVEVYARTELSFERATDGLRIQLSTGSILVNAAKQRNGHLYVQTKDFAISVVGTVFLVRAEQQGSRVAVIEGEVHVRKGTTTERLLPGEQVASSSELSAPPVVQEISWSRHAAEHFALLQQSSVPAATKPGSQPRETFEVASIRRSIQPSGPGARGGGGATIDPGPCPGSSLGSLRLQFQLDPGRLVIRNMNLYNLVALAYGNRCPAPGTISGGEDWIRSENYDIQAKIPEGTPAYTKEQLLGGNAPQLQRMLQSLLENRFKLVLQRQMKEMPAFNLIVAETGKLKLSADQTPDALPQRGQNGRGAGAVMSWPLSSAPITRLVMDLQQELGRPVVDKTGLKGLYDIFLQFPEMGALPTAPPPNATPAEIENQDRQIDDRFKELLPKKLEEVTGLRLEPAKAPIEVLVIKRAEGPTEN